MTVEELLQRRDIYYIPKGGDFLVSCLNPEHADRNPSMRIDQLTGIFGCFSCNHKGNLFAHFGEKADLKVLVCLFPRVQNLMKGLGAT